MTELPHSVFSQTQILGEMAAEMQEQEESHYIIQNSNCMYLLIFRHLVKKAINELMNGYTIIISRSLFCDRRSDPDHLVKK